jgi:prepilin-type N-terminal cleavage/methylation domain-containing protein
MKDRIASSRKGLTLIELLVALGILAVVIAATYTVLTTGFNTYNMNLESSVSQSSARTAMITLTRQAHATPRAQVSVNGAQNELTLDGAVYKASGGSLYRGSAAIVQNISSLSVSIDAAHMLSITVTASDGSTLRTQIYLK